MKAKKGMPHSKINVFHFYENSKKKKKNYGKLKKNNGNGNKTFWKIIVFSFPDRIVSEKQISLVKIMKLSQKIVM